MRQVSVKTARARDARGRLARARSPVVLKIARFVNLFLVGLLAGLLVGVFIVEWALLDVSATVYTAVEKPKHEVFAPIMPSFNTLVIVSGLVLLLMRDRKAWAFGLTAVGVVCTIALTTTTLLVNVPINSEIISTWSVNDPPAD